MNTDPIGLVGGVIDGQFRVDRWIGEGGFSVVYRGHHLGLDEAVAIKCLKPLHEPPAVVEDFVNRFRDEGRIAYRLSQGNLDIVRAIASGVTESSGRAVPYMVLEWLDGESLSSQFLERRAKAMAGRPLSEVVRMFTPAAEALAYAHAQGVIHRDVKPGNVFVAKARDGGTRLKVLDFGMAKFAADAQAAGPGFSRLARSMGNIAVFSPPYAAPEQFDPKVGAVGAHTDVYSFALLVVEALTDRRVRTGSGLAECLIQACVQPRSLSTHAKGVVPPAVERVLDRALSINPSDRPENMGEFWHELRNAMQGDPKETEDPSSWSAGDSLPPDADGPATIVGETHEWLDDSEAAPPPAPPPSTSALASEEATRNVIAPQSSSTARGLGVPRPPVASGDRPSQPRAEAAAAGRPVPRPFARTMAGGFGAGGRPNVPRAAGSAPGSALKGSAPSDAKGPVLPPLPVPSASSPDMTVPHVPEATGESGDSEPPTLALMSKDVIGDGPNPLRIPGHSDMPTTIGAPPALEIPRAAPTGMEDWNPPSQPLAPVPGLPLPQVYGAVPPAQGGGANVALGKTMPLSAAYEQQVMEARAQAMASSQSMQAAAAQPGYGLDPYGQPGMAPPGMAPHGMAPQGMPPHGMPGADPWQGGASGAFPPGFQPFPGQNAAPPPKSKMALIGVLAGLAVLLLLGVGFGAYAMFSSPPEDPAIEGLDMTATAAPTTTETPATPATAVATAATAESAEADAAAAEIATAAADPSTTATPPTETAPKPTAVDPPVAAATTATATPKPTPVAPTSVAVAPTPTHASTSSRSEKVAATDPTKFNATAARASIKTMEGMLASCKKPDGPTGAGKARVTFRNDGSVMSSVMLGPPYEGTPVGNCVASRFKAARAPKFEGSPGVVDYGFTISR